MIRQAGLVLCGLGVLVASTLAKPYTLVRPAKDPATARELLGERCWAVLAAPETFEVLRVSGESPEELRPPHAEGHPVQDRAEKPPKDAARRAAAVLTDDRSYNFEAFGQNKWCGGFRPGVALKFTRGDDSLTILLCFVCNDLVAVLRDKKGEQVHATMADFSAARLTLVDLAKECFPKDEAIQKLGPTAKPTNE